MDEGTTYVQRELEALGLRCQVIAPSLIPSKPGDHSKTDRRDARKLAELLEAGLLTEVHPPTPGQGCVVETHLGAAGEKARHHPILVLDLINTITYYWWRNLPS